MKTSIIIRDATPRDRYVQATTSTKSRFNDSFDISHVAHKFPKLDLDERQWLKERLGKAITQRRQYLKYCRDHHNRFQEPEKMKGPRSEGLGDDHISDSDQKPDNEAVTTMKSLPVSASVPTDASTLQISKLKPFEQVSSEAAENTPDILSQTSYASSVYDNDDRCKMFPPRLKDITDTFPFECPYCWNLQDIKSERLWR